MIANKIATPLSKPALDSNSAKSIVELSAVNCKAISSRTTWVDIGIVASIPAMLLFANPAIANVNRVEFAHSHDQTSFFVNTQKGLTFIKENFVLTNEADIVSYLPSKSSEFSDDLIECYHQIRTHFVNVVPSMELVTDMEDSQWKTLVIRVNSNDIEASFIKLRSIMNWLTNQSKDFKRSVTISVS